MADTDIRALVETKSTDLEGLLSGSGITLDRFKATVFQLWERDAQLRRCRPDSILSGVMAVADVGLTFTPSLGYAYLVKFGDSAVPIIGWRGLVHLALRSGGALDIRAGIRRQGEHFKFRPLHPTEPIEHEPLATYDEDGNPSTDAEASTGKEIGYYAVAFLPGSLARAEYMDRAAIEKHRDKYSRAAKDGPWVAQFNEMAMKTVVRRLCKYLRVSGQLEKAVHISDAVDTQLGGGEELPPDNLPNALAGEGSQAPTASNEVSTSTSVSPSKRPANSPANLVLSPDAGNTKGASGRPHATTSNPAPATPIDSGVVAMLSGMYRQRHNGKLSGADEWLMEHFNIDDFSELKSDEVDKCVKLLTERE